MQNSFSRFKWISMLQAKTNVKYFSEHNLKGAWRVTHLCTRQTNSLRENLSGYWTQKCLFEVKFLYCIFLKAKCITRCYYA